METTRQFAQEKPETLMRIDAVMALTSLGKTTIYTSVKAGTFPKPLKLSARRVVWRASDIATWQAERLQAVTGEQP